jgi:hypothetical protein
MIREVTHARTWWMTWQDIKRIVSGNRPVRTVRSHTLRRLTGGRKRKLFKRARCVEWRVK